MLRRLSGSGCCFNNWTMPTIFPRRPGTMRWKFSPTSLKKDMSKFVIEDIPRYTVYPVVFNAWDPAAFVATS